MFLPALPLYVSSASVTAAGPDIHRSICGLVPTAISVHALCCEQQSAAAAGLLSLSIHHSNTYCSDLFILHNLHPFTSITTYDSFNS